MAGPLGPRGWTSYTSDTGHIYNIRMRDADSNAVGNTLTGQDAAPEVPKSIKPRHIWLLAADGQRRRVNIGALNNPLYSTGGTVTIDGILWLVKGRVGEKGVGSVKG